MEELLRRPQADGRATLVLIDEVLMYARDKVDRFSNWRGLLIDFFAHLCDPLAKVDRCAMVVSLLASDPMKDDAFGKELIGQVSEIFNKIQRANGSAGVERRCCRGASATLFRAGVGGRSGGLPTACDDRCRQHRRTRREHPQRPEGCGPPRRRAAGAARRRGASVSAAARSSRASRRRKAALPSAPNSMRASCRTRSGISGIGARPPVKPRR
jgi:hypothetical protein